MNTSPVIRRRIRTHLLLVVAGLAALSAPAAVYDFLPVTITGADTAKFTSPNANGFINVVTTGTNAMQFNNTVIQSQFTNLFAPSGVVPGWLSRYNDYGHYTNTFYLTNYVLSTNLIFGIWNITEETNEYRLQLFAGNTQIAPPFNWNFIGYDDNVFPPDVNIAWKHMNLDFNTGYFNPTSYVTGPKTDCDAAFWSKIPSNTTHIVIVGRLSTNNHDGVSFYFAEPQPPCTLICPPDIAVTVCGPGTNVSFPLPTWIGDCGSNVTFNIDPASGSFFALGTNTVNVGIQGQTNVCSFKVIVTNSDTNPPVLTCPTTNIVVFTCGSNAVVNYTVTATDDSGWVTTNCSPPSGSTFPLGTNAVSCVAVDPCSNATTCAFYVIVKQLPPTWGVICPPESNFINVTGCPPIMPSVTNLVTITNQCALPFSLSVTQSPPAGTVLGAGMQNVIIGICDPNGNCEYCTVLVSATISSNCCDLVCPTNLIVAACGTNAIATFPTPVVTGPCATNTAVVCSPPSGSSFPAGTNTVTCIATNGLGVTVVACDFKVVVLSSGFTNAYDFLRLNIIGNGGRFISPNGNGFITVTNTGGPFLGLNNTKWASQFPNLFPASGTVTGWLAQADNNATYTNTFYLSGYALKPNTVFGIWNITEETNAYSIRLLNSTGGQIAPTFNWNFLGYDDDALAGSISWHHMVLNPGTGFLAPTQYTAFGIDCDAAFWDNLPPNTHRIVVTGTLGALNADGAVFYFAERRPCPSAPCPFCQSPLTATLAEHNLILTWRAGEIDYDLEETEDLVSPLPWQTVTNSPTLSDGEYRVSIPVQHPRKFYRLRPIGP